MSGYYSRCTDYPGKHERGRSRMSDYKCAYCGRELADLDEVCDCGNAVGVLDL